MVLGKLLELTKRKSHNVGPDHPQWDKFRTETNKRAARARAQRRFRLGPCKECGKNGTERHHKDGDPFNNAEGNVDILCRRCHMIVDGRTEAFAKLAGNRKGKKRTWDIWKNKRP
jgi:hypothetical protein